MEPGHNGPSLNHEQAPSLPPVSPEQLPGVSPEQSPEQTPERPPSRQEQQPAPQVDNDAALAQVVATPAPPPAIDDNTVEDDTAQLLAALPDVANDDNQIEKEWIVKTKQIISETSHDPHKREVAINALKLEYQRKRYGRETPAAD